MKKLVFAISTALIALALVSFGFTKIQKATALICNQKYALCSAAQCIPDPKNPNESICFCDVYEGKNYGYSSCDKRAAITDQDDVEHIISTFSMENFQTRKNMSCPSGNPWSNCLDQPCIVDPLNPKQAICMCKVVKTGEFVTFGGDCDTSTCSTGFWSGATPKANLGAVQQMMEALGLQTSPQRFCPRD